MSPVCVRTAPGLSGPRCRPRLGAVRPPRPPEGLLWLRRMRRLQRSIAVPRRAESAPRAVGVVKATPRSPRVTGVPLRTCRKTPGIAHGPAGQRGRPPPVGPARPPRPGVTGTGLVPGFKVLGVLPAGSPDHPVADGGARHHRLGHAGGHRLGHRHQPALHGQVSGAGRRRCQNHVYCLQTPQTGLLRRGVHPPDSACGARFVWFKQNCGFGVV